MICPDCNKGELKRINGILTCTVCKITTRSYITLADLSSERPLRNRGEAEAVVAELRRVIRMMKCENTIDYSEGFFPFMKIREDKLIARIKEIKQETEGINE